MHALYCPDETRRFVLTPTARNRIKLATKELRSLTGLTLEEIAARTHASKSQWHNYENIDKPDLIPVHVYLPLELELGQAPVTRAMAAMNGLAVTTEAASLHRVKAAELMGRAARDSGEALATLAEVIADDHITPNEARRLDHVFAEVEHDAAAVRTLAAEILAGEG
jgi:transcriptional regulator with XRE-family HTH domain